MESKLKGIIKYLQFVDCILNAANQNEESWDKSPKQQEEAYLGLPIY